MNIKKAIGAGLLVFAVQFASVSVVGNTIGPFLGQSTWAGYAWQAAMALLLAGIVYCIARWYFSASASSTLQGAYLGLIIVATSFIVNLLQTIPALAFGQDIVGPLMQYVTSISFLITAVITIGAAAFAGCLKAKNKPQCDVQNAIKTCMPNAGEDTKAKD